VTTGIHATATRLQQSEVQASSELFGNVSAATPMQGSSYYSTEQSTISSTTPITEAASGAFADLLGDFVSAKTHVPVDFITPSPAGTNEYVTDNYRFTLIFYIVITILFVY
jgi:hypothetical protein